MAKDNERRPTVAERIAAGTFGEHKKPYGSLKGQELAPSSEGDRRTREMAYERDRAAYDEIDSDLRGDDNLWEERIIRRQSIDDGRGKRLDKVIR